MNRWFGYAGAIAAAGLVAAGSATLGQAPEFSPAGAWDLQQGAESCTLIRDFGSDGQALQLRIESFGRTTPYQIVLTGDGLPIREQKAELVEAGFGGADAARSSLGVIGKIGRKGIIAFPGSAFRATNMIGWLYLGAPATLGIPVDRGAETLYFDTVDMDPVTLQLGPMSREFARLDECVRLLEDQWAANAAGGAVPASAPELIDPNQSNWRTKYPQNLLLNRVSGLAHIRMTIDEKGRARDCVVQASTWAKRFGEDACANFEKWRRFEPATDASGKPVPALYRISVVYAIYNWG